VVSPCAACKILRRRCVEKCVLAPYFPPTDPLKFTIAHRVFGASNIIKFLQVTYIHYSPIKNYRRHHYFWLVLIQSYKISYDYDRFVHTVMAWHFLEKIK
jgi:hypothetical protein